MKKSLLSEITRALKAINLDDIKRANKSLSEVQEGETVLLVIEDDEAIRLWTLAHCYERDHALAMYSARFDVGPSDAREQLLREAARFQSMEELVRPMAWRRIEDLIYPPAKNDLVQSYGLRNNFTLVGCPVPAQPQSIVNAVPFPPELMGRLIDAIRKRTRQAEDDINDTPKPKPQ